MVNWNLIRNLDSEEELRKEIESHVSTAEQTGLATIESESDVSVNEIVEGRVIRMDDQRVVVDVGFKSEGVIPLS